MKNLIFHLSTKLKNHLSSGNGPAMDRKRPGVGLADVCRFTAVLVMLFSFNIGNVWGASATWELVETEPADWSGEYLIVYDGYCFDGSLDGGFDQHTPVSVTVNNKKITLDDSYSLTVAVSGTKYSLKSKSGYYIGRNANSNGVDANKTWSTNYTVVFNTWNNTNKTVRIVGNGGRAVGRNGSSWRFYSTANAYVNIQMYKKASSCTGLTMSTVTAVPGNGSISLSWSAVTNADSYTVTCKNKSTGVAAGTGTGSKTGTSCTISGLDNGTEYTWSVEPVGSGTYCSSNTPTTGDATPNVYYTVTFMSNGSTYDTKSIASGSNLVLPDNPSSCDVSKEFVGWSTNNIGSTPTDTKPTTFKSTFSTISANTTLYAVFAKKTANSYKLGDANDLIEGQKVLIVNQNASQAMSNTNNSGKLTATGVTISSSTISSPAASLIWTVELDGATKYKFKNTYYVYAYSTSSIYCDDDDSEYPDSWTLTYAGSTGKYYMHSDRGTSSYRLQDYSSNFKLYTSNTTEVFKQSFFIPAYTKYVTQCCTNLASINGSISWTNPTTAVLTWDNIDHVSSWAASCIVHGGSSAGSVGSITTNGAGKKTCTVTGLSCNTNYDFTISATAASGYCDKSQTIENENSGTWSVTSTITNGTKTSVPTTACGDYTATFAASSGFHFPAKGDITVTGASDFGWNSSTGVLTISGANITGDITISITCPADACSDQFSLHTGNKDQGGWVTNQCFVDADWGAVDDAIYVGAFPLTNECYVGWEGGGSYYGANWAVGGIKTYDIPTGRTLGWDGSNYYHDYPGGALGTFHIYKNSTEVNGNYYLRFKPSSYILRTGSDGTSWTSREMTVSATNSHYYETAELDLTSTLISEHAYVDLKTNGGDGHVWCNFSNDRTASGNVKVKSSVGDADGNFRGDNLKASDNGTHGKFRIDITKDVDNWKLAFVPMYRITYAAGTGASGSMDPSSYAEISTTIAAAANGYTAPTGKQFNGWSDGVNSYAAGANVTMNSNVTLTAQWTDIDYTVTVSQSPDVSATTTGQTSSAHYNTTINLTTTVPSGYRFVNWTTSDGFSITNPTSATTASFTMPNKNVTVTANFQQTHTIDWYVGGSAPGNKLPSSGQTVVVDHGGSITTLPSEPSGSACDKEFMGWTNTSSYTHGTSPLYSHNTASFPAINADASFYAVFATESGSPITWNQVTDATNVNAGTYVIVASTTSYTRCLPNNGSSDAAPSFSTNVTISNGQITSTVTDAMKWNFSDGTWDDDDDAKYMEGITITSVEETPRYLHNIDNNNGVRINSTSDTWTIGNHESGTADVLYMRCNGRYCGVYNNADWRSYTTYNATNYEADAGSSKIKLFKQTGGTTYSDYTIVCGSCSNEVTVAYTAAPAGGTVAVTKGGTPVAVNGTVKTCTGGASLVVTVTPSTHYSVSGVTFTPSAGLVAGDLSGTSTPASTTAGVWTYNVTIAEDAAGTLTIAPTLVEEAHIAITWNVNGVALSPSPAEGLTWVYSGGDITALPSTPSVPAGCTGTKVFAGWSTKHSDATEEDASYYDDLFTSAGPTGITSAKTYYAVFATSSANPLAGEVMWDEPWTGTSDKTAPTSPSSGATVYNSTVLTYAYTNGNTTTQVYADGTMYSGGAAAPELLISKTSPSGVWTVTNIPTGGSAQTELTLSYKTNKTTIAVTSGTSGITIGDATVDGNTYTHTITINHSPSTINNFSLIFTNTGSANARIDDIHLVVPGSGTMTDYVTLCAPSWTITYNKNTSDAVTNLPSPTSVLQSTGSGTLSSTVPERATYTFSGWAETPSGAVAYAAGGSITGITGDKTLYAVWVKTPVEELFLNYSELNKYVGDPAVTLEVTGVTPEGADPSVTWSSNNSSVASVVAATGVVTFGTVGTATITATSTVTGTTTAYCYVTVRNKPTASFTDLIHDGNGTDLDDYFLQDVAGTSIVFPTLDDYASPGDDCDTKHYIFVGWTTSDNNDDPKDHLVASGELEDDQDKVFYAVWADGVEGVSYTQLTTSTFKTSPTKYVIGAIDGDDTFYFYSCAATDENNGNGGCTNAPGTNAPIQFTLSGTAAALVATSTEATARYLTPLTAKNFQMSATSKTIQLNDDGTIANPSDESWTLRFNTSEDYLRWYSSATGNAAYFYEVTSGAAVSYRTSCCTNNVAAPTVVVTNTAYTVTLTWAAVDGATGYEVSWNGGAFEAATSPCVKSGLTASTDYIYKVRATYDPLVKCGALVASGSVTTDDVYSVTYSGGTGTGSCSPSGSVAPASYEAGATVTLAPTNSFSLTSNTFAAWVVKDADDNDVPVSNNQFTMPAKNVTVTATWTAVQDKYYDRMHDGTDASHGGIADGEGKYYLVLEGCNYTVPALTDDDDGDTDCHTTHYKLLGWIAYSHLKTDGSGEIKPGEESYIFQGGGTKSATGATYYAVWAIMTE